MECQPSDSKKLFKVFDSSKRKRTRKKREGLDDSNSLATDDSNSACQATVMHVTSAKASLQDVPTAQTVTVGVENKRERDRDSSPSPGRGDHRADHRACRSPRRHRRSTREGMSLALKAGMVSTPRSTSPHQGLDGTVNSMPKDEDSFIYAFLEETIKMDKKRQRHLRRHEERRESREREDSATREHRHHHRHRRDHCAPKESHRDRSRKEENNSPTIDQTVLFQTFAKLCAQLNEKGNAFGTQSQMPRTLSHKSLQCEVTPKHNLYEVEHRPVRLHGGEHSRDNVTKSRSHEHFGKPCHCDYDRQTPRPEKHDKCMCCCDKDINQYASKVSMVRSRTRNINDVYPHDIPDQSVNNIDNNYRPRPSDYRCSRDYDRQYVRERHYDSDKRRYCDQKTSRSFDIQRECPDDDKYCRRTARSDNMRDKVYDEREKYYDKRMNATELHDGYVKDRRMKRNDERCDRNSIASRDEDTRDRDKYSERERDSGLSVADGETSTISGKSNYMKVVKQEIAEQRETMDKMMKLWKELMRCFKGLSTQEQNKNVQESAASAQESAAAQLRLWRECMRRYETVARDVGDTDARLMEEINKQRSEMAEMASMWQECLQRYREISSDFDTLKQQVTVTKQQYVTHESPTRLPAAPVACAEGEPVPPAPYRLPSHYPQMPVSGGYGYGVGGGGGGGSPLRPRASAPAPPPWWWCEERARSPRRRSSPDSRGSRSRHERRHRDDRRPDNSRSYKEKSSKPSGARSEHRHRKR